MLSTGVQGSGASAAASVASTTNALRIHVGPVLSPEVVAGEAFTNLDVADFWTSLRHASASDFTATISWGDGSSATAGTVVPLVFPFLSSSAGAAGTAGSLPMIPAFGFSVTGGHTYTGAGSDTADITIKDSAGDTATTTADITVSATRLTVQPITSSFQAVTGVAYNHIPLAGFTDLGVPPGTQVAASDYTATINWGDGTTTSGDVTPDFFAAPLNFTAPPASFDVSGAHEYTTTGNYNVQVTISDQAGDTVSASRTIDVSTLSLSATGKDVSVLTGQQGPPLVVATLMASPAGAHVPLSDYSVSINWGDGTSATAGQVVGASILPVPLATAADALTGGTLEVVGQHTYMTSGTYTINVTINGPGGASAMATSTATVDGIAAQGISFSATTNQADNNQTVAEFHTANASAVASDFTATINWGDGTTSAGTVAAVSFPFPIPWAGGGTATPGAPTSNAGPAILPVRFDQFTVSGSHTYTAAGNYTVTVTITDASGDTATTTSTAIVTNDTITAYPVPVSVAPGKSSTVTVATFHDQAGLPASDFTATIDWGDGTTSAGTVEMAPIMRPLAATTAQPIVPLPWESFYIVTGTHTYATTGKYTIQVMISSTLGASANVTTTANVSTSPTPVVRKPHPTKPGKHSGHTKSPKPVVHHPAPRTTVHTSSTSKPAHHAR